MSTLTPLHQIDLESGHLTKPSWSPNGRLLAMPAQSGSITIFDLYSEQVTKTLGPHSGEVTAVTWDRKSELILTGSLDRSVGLWEVSTGRRAPLEVSGHKEPVHSVQWTDEEAIAVTCSADRIRVLDGACLHTGWTEEMEDAMNESTGFVASSCSHRTTFLLAALAEHGRLLILANALSADVLDTVRMKEPARCLAWSPEEELLAVGAGRSLLVFHATHEGFKGSPRELTKNAPHIYALSFSGDGTLIASDDAHGLKIWKVESGRLIRVLDENNEKLAGRYPPAGIAFHPAEMLLATVTPRGNALRILDLR
jgi:WD40 repeat protein